MTKKAQSLASIEGTHYQICIASSHIIFAKTAQYHIGSVCRMAIGSSCLHETIALADQASPEMDLLHELEAGF